MNWQKRLYNYIKKMLHSTKHEADGIDSVNCQSSHPNMEQSLKFYDFNSIKLIDFEKCMNGQLEYMHVDKIITIESKLRYMDIYYKYIEIVGGGKEWAYIYREYVDLKVKVMVLNFAKEMIRKNIFHKSKLEAIMIEYDFVLPVDHELAMIDSYMATIEMQLDSIIKRINKREDVKNDSTLVTILTQINEVYKLYLPYNSILLCEFCEWYKKLNELSKKSKFKKNG